MCRGQHLISNRSASEGGILDGGGGSFDNNDSFVMKIR